MVFLLNSSTRDLDCRSVERDLVGVDFSTSFCIEVCHILKFVLYRKRVRHGRELRQ